MPLPTLPGFRKAMAQNCGKVASVMGRAIYCMNRHFLDYKEAGEMDDGDWPAVHESEVRPSAPNCR
jgi:hypothetical protein